MPHSLAPLLNPLILLRAFFAAAVCGGLLFVFPSSPAMSADHPSGVAGVAVARLAPPLVPTTAAATPAAALDECAVILRGDAPMGGRAVPAHYSDNLMPMAIIGMMTGVNHVTGPRERAHAFMPDNQAASLDGRNARAIAAYRHCRAEANLRTLSN